MNRKVLALIALFAAVVFAGSARTANAQSADELTAQVNALLAQIAQLQGGASMTGCYSFTRDLTVGSQGADVTALQTYLMSTGHFTFSGGATGYFGPITASAVAAWQSANGVMPAAGYFGPISRAKYNSLCGGVVVVPGDDDDDDGDDDDDDGTLSGGEADLSGFDASSGDDSGVEEGGSGDVYEFEFDVDDGDVRIERVDLMFTNDSGFGDEDPWDVFGDVTLMLNGEEVGSEDGSDEENWDEDADEEYRLRFSGIDEIVNEDETAEFVVNVELQNNVDDIEDGIEWTIWVSEEGVRALDGEGIDHTIGDADTLAGAAEEVAFDLDEEGEGEELQLRSSSDDPDATTLLVDADDTSDWFDVFIFRIEAEENDFDIEELVLEAVIGGGAAYEDVVDDVVVEIDGEEFDADVTGGNTATATLTFDIDGDLTISGDDIVDAVVMMKFRSTEDGDNYGSGTTTVQVSTVSVEGEGADDFTDTATVSGEEHTLSTSPATVSNVDWQTSESDTSAVIDFFFTVTADEDDVDVLGAEILDDPNGTFNATTVGVQSSSGDGTLTRVSGDDVVTLGGETGFTVAEGDTVRFRVRYETTTTGSHEVLMESVAGQTIADDDQLSPTVVLD